MGDWLLPKGFINVQEQWEKEIKSVSHKCGIITKDWPKEWMISGKFAVDSNYICSVECKPKSNNRSKSKFRRALQTILDIQFYSKGIGRYQGVKPLYRLSYHNGKIRSNLENNLGCMVGNELESARTKSGNLVTTLL